MTVAGSPFSSGFVRAISVAAALHFTTATAPAEAPAAPPDIAAAFESTVVRMGVPPGVVAMPLHWEFTNRWDFPLVVEAFEISCGCLSGAVDASKVEEVAPGANGRIGATFTPGPYRGTVRKSMRVRFVGHESAVELVAEVTIPSSVELSARELVWHRGGSPPAQTIEVTSGTGAPFRITALRGVTPREFDILSETLVEGLHYRLTVTPRKEALLPTKCLQIQTDSADSRDRMLAVFLRTGVEEPEDQTDPAATAASLPPSNP